MDNLKLKKLLLAAIFSAVIVIASWIQIPFTVPFTLQVFAIGLAVGLLGPLYGTLSVIVYILLGLVGLPVFSGFSGGVGALFGVTGGYIFGFIFFAVIEGLFVKFFGTKFYILVLGMVAGLIVCYTVGTLWFSFNYFGAITLKNVISSLTICVVPFLIPDIAKILLSGFLVIKLKKLINID